MVDMTARPFNLDPDAQSWVTSTLGQMSEDAKIGQLFCLMTMASDPAAIDAELEIMEPCGYMLRPMPASEVERIHRHLQSKAKIPMMLAANLEKGADGLMAEGTNFGNPLQVAATDSPENAYRMGVATGAQARALGGTWGFSPVCDVQSNFLNPITNTRAFGSDAARVGAMSRAFTEGLQSQGLAASPKHFPGDGVDDRDQHLVTSVNSLSVEDWDSSFGMVYSGLIEAGAKTIMVGHIAMPEYSRKLRPGIADRDIMPATLAPELLQGLLREQLGFEGVIVTDASLMNGFAMAMPREQAVPNAIAAGCDVFLFSTNVAEDMEFMRAGLRSGLLSEARLDEAVTRVLAMKASIGIHAASLDELVPGAAAFDALNLDEHRTWAREIAEQSVTLVKDLEDGLLPLNPASHPRILIYSVVDSMTALMSAFMGGGATQPPATQLAAHLESSGFAAKVFERPGEMGIEMLMGGADAVGRAELLENYDAVIYIAQCGPSSNVPTIRLAWTQLTANDSPKYLTEIPTIFISLASPFHLQDVPRIRTFINAYADNDDTIKSVADRLVGKSEFTGVSPVDPFCGYWDARL